MDVIVPMPQPKDDTPTSTYVPLLDANGNPVWNDDHTAIIMVQVEGNSTLNNNGTNGIGMGRGVPLICTYYYPCGIDFHGSSLLQYRSIIRTMKHCASENTHAYL